MERKLSMKTRNKHTLASAELFRSINTDITPRDFEILCMETLKAYAEKENLSGFAIKDNRRIETYDGTYQIDVYAEFMALGAKNTVLVECKKKVSRKVERDDVMLLYGKLQSLGANKGILISTTGFQKGAVQYAKKHGITLWQAFDNWVKPIVASGRPEFSNKLKLQIFAKQYLPRYFVMEWDCNTNHPIDRIYPTMEMYRAAIEKAKENYHD